jgi:hypothetical protein
MEIATARFGLRLVDFAAPTLRRSDSLDVVALTPDQRDLFDDLGVAADLASARTPEESRVVVLSYIHACHLVVDPPDVVDVFDHAARHASP